MPCMPDLVQDIDRQQALNMTLVPGWQRHTLPRDHPGAGGVASDEVAARYLGTCSL